MYGWHGDITREMEKEKSGNNGGQLFFNKCTEAIQWERKAISIHGTGTAGCSCGKEMKLDSVAHHQQKPIPHG